VKNCTELATRDFPRGFFAPIAKRGTLKGEGQADTTTQQAGKSI